MTSKKSKGNMYPWVDQKFTPIGGECPHACTYCYVDHVPFGRPEKYKGEIRLLEREFRRGYGFRRPQVCFIGHMHDLWAHGVPDAALLMILKHCRKWPENTYVFQTKNPARYNGIYQPEPYQERLWLDELPPKVILGCTIETNFGALASTVSKAPPVRARFLEMRALRQRAPQIRTFITIEPILDFDPLILAEWLEDIRPEFVNIGADSKKHRLPEPSGFKVYALLDQLQTRGVPVREKHNLDRLLAKN